MIPDYQTLMLPVLKAAQGGEISIRDTVKKVSQDLSLSDDERDELLPSGRQRVIDNRINWAKSYLKQAGLVKYTRRGFYVLTDVGKVTLEHSPDRIDNNYLMQFDTFKQFRSRKHEPNSQATNSVEVVDDHSATPDEDLRLAYKKINEALSADLLDRVRQSTPQFFEQLIVDLLVAMGYGGASEDAGHALGRSGDNGVDGVIDQDPLGVDQIYIQAKRYAEGNNIGSGAIREFFGALNLKNAQKGIFITSSSFSPAAIQTANDLGMRIVLIDGLQLTKLMIKYNVGCQDEEILRLKKIDEEFFE